MGYLYILVEQWKGEDRKGRKEKGKRVYAPNPKQRYTRLL